MGKKIAIIGTTTSLFDAPYDDESWEIWGLNGAYTAVKRWDRWFDMHDIDVLKKHHNPEYFPFLKEAGNRLTLNQKCDEYPDAKIFPYQELVKLYRPYFTNTVSWLLALAMEQEDVVEIGVWGVNMAQDTEYAKQRPSCEYFLGIAEGRGIKITIPDGSELLKATNLYGIEPLPAIMAKIPDKQREIKISHQDTMRQLEEKQAELNYINGYIKGTIETVDHTLPEVKRNVKITTFMNDRKASVIKEKQNRAKQVNGELNTLLDKKQYWQGACDLMQYYIVNWGG